MVPRVAQSAQWEREMVAMSNGQNMAPFTEAARLAVLREYEEWHAARTVLHHRENKGKGVDSGDWAGSDDSGIELLHDLVSKLVKVDECGHKTAEASEQEDGTYLVECEHCPAKWSVKDGEGRTV